MRRATLLGLAAAALVVAGLAIAQTSKQGGRIGPQSRVQPSGRKLRPVGKLTRVGNHPAGAALTRGGRFYWTVSAGRGRNDIRIVRVTSGIRCKKPRRPKSVRRGASKKAKARYRRKLRRYRSKRKAYTGCRRRAKRRIGKLVQVLPLPGASGGIAMSPDGRTAYVSGLPETKRADQVSPPGTPGKEGDVIHVFHYDGRTGLATRAGTIPVPAPGGSPIPQDFPPRTTDLAKQAWPRDIAVSPDGKKLLVALNLADRAAIVDVASRQVRYVFTGHYPYGAAITSNGKLGLVSNEAEGNVSVIDLAAGRKRKDIQVGPHLSHPEGITIDPKAERAYVAVTQQDLIAVIDTSKLTVSRTLSVGQPEGIGTAPVDVSVTQDGCFLLSPDSGEDAIATFALPQPGGGTCRNGKRKRRKRARAHARLAEAILQREGRRGASLSRSRVRKRTQAWQIVGRVPVGSYPVDVQATPKRGSLVWLAAKGLGVGPNPNGPNPNDPRDSDNRINSFQYLPSIVSGMTGIAKFPTDAKLGGSYSARAARQIRPINPQRPPPGTPIRAPGAGQKIKHVFYIVKENRTYDQVLGDDPRGDGDPKLTLFGERYTPNMHALARRFPLLDHVYANSEASVDGHFWTSAANVPDYVTKNWHQNYGGRHRPYDFGVYAVTWPSQRFLFDQAEKQGISYFNYGEAIAGMVFQLPDKDRRAAERSEILAKQNNSDLNIPATPLGCYPNTASSGGVDEVLSLGPGPEIEVYDSSLPPGAKLGSFSRFGCFRRHFNRQLAQGRVPAFNYVPLLHDHTAGAKPGRRTPRAMIAENDYALGQVVDLISHSPIWKDSLILVVEDDSQDGADHVDAHRIPAFAISPYAKRGAVIHARYDFLSFIRTLEIVVGMKPLNLFDALATPMYDVFSGGGGNAEPYNAIPPNFNLTERNTNASPNAVLSRGLPLDTPDRVPQRYLDRILWQSVHGPASEPPPPGPNASGADEQEWRRSGRAVP